MDEKYLAIRYIILRLAQEFNIFHYKNENNVEFFNEHNNFSFEKSLLLPYIVTIANGHKDFFINDSGIFNKSFMPIFESDNERVELIKSNGVSYTIEDFHNLLNLEFSEDRSKLVLFENDFISIKNITISKDIITAINYSIDFIMERRYKNFPTLDVKSLESITSENGLFYIFSKYKNSFNNNAQLILAFNNALKIATFSTARVNALEKEIQTQNVAV